MSLCHECSAYHPRHDVRLLNISSMFTAPVTFMMFLFWFCFSYIQPCHQIGNICIVWYKHVQGDDWASPVNMQSKSHQMSQICGTKLYFTFDQVRAFFLLSSDNRHVTTWSRSFCFYCSSGCVRIFWNIYLRFDKIKWLTFWNNKGRPNGYLSTIQNAVSEVHQAMLI